MNNNFDQQDQPEDEGWQGGGGAQQAGEVKLDLSDPSDLARFFCHTKCNDELMKNDSSVSAIEFELIVDT